MGSLQKDTYLEDVPDNVDISQEEWDELSYHAQYNRANDRKEQKRKQWRRRYKDDKEWSDSYQRKRGCTICDEDEPACLVFHHVGEKTAEVSNLLGNAKRERLVEEAEQCIILCANCHRKHHAGLIETERLK